MRRSLRHSLLLVLVLVPGLLSGTRPAPVPVLLECTPEGFREPGGQLQRTEHPIVAALEQARPGTTIRLAPGDYEPFTIGMPGNAPTNARTHGGTRAQPIVVDGLGGARVVGTQGDAIAIDQGVPCRWITFRNLTIVPGRRAGVLFFQRRDGRDHVGFAFEDCSIEGGFDHRSGTGHRSRWGVWGQRLKDFRFVGLRAPARIEGISDEHALYLQNPQGRIEIQNVQADGLGRTFLQITCRPGDGPPGQGLVLVSRCQVANVGLAAGDGYRGGTAFTVAGRYRGLLVFKDNVFRGGFDPLYRQLHPPGGVHGTGAFVAWEGGGDVRNGTLVLNGNDFRMAPGCGDRPLVAISACDRVRVIGANHFVSGGDQPALALEPVDDQGRSSGGEPNGAVQVVPQTVLEGPVTLRGEALEPAALAALAKPLPGDGR